MNYITNLVERISDYSLGDKTSKSSIGSPRQKKCCKLYECNSKECCQINSSSLETSYEELKASKGRKNCMSPPCIYVTKPDNSTEEVTSRGSNTSASYRASPNSSAANSDETICSCHSPSYGAVMPEKKREHLMDNLNAGTCRRKRAKPDRQLENFMVQEFRFDVPMAGPIKDRMKVIKLRNDSNKGKKVSSKIRFRTMHLDRTGAVSKKEYPEDRRYRKMDDALPGR